MATDRYGNELTLTGQDLRWHPGQPDPAETLAARRERQRMANLRRSWYAQYEEDEWWRTFHQGWSYTALVLMAVFALGLIIGYLAHGASHA